MRPSDPRLRRQLAPARVPLLRVGAYGVLGSLLLIAQAWAVTMLVLAVRSGAVPGIDRPIFPGRPIRPQARR